MKIVVAVISLLALIALSSCTQQSVLTDEERTTIRADIKEVIDAEKPALKKAAEAAIEQGAAKLQDGK